MEPNIVKGDAQASGNNIKEGNGVNGHTVITYKDSNHKQQQLNVVDLQSPIGGNPKDHVALNIERVQAAKSNLMKMRNFRNRQDFSPTKVGVLFKPNEFMDRNLVKSKHKKNEKEIKEIHSNSKKPSTLRVIKQQKRTHINNKNQEKEVYRYGRSKSDCNISMKSSVSASETEFTEILFPAPSPKNIRKMRQELHNDNKPNAGNNNINNNYSFRSSSPRGSQLKTYSSRTPLIRLPQGKKVSVMRSNYDTLKTKGFLNPMQISSISNDNSMYVTNLNVSEYFKQSMEGKKLSNIKKTLRNELHSLKFYRTPTPERLKRENKKMVVLSPSVSIQSLNHSLSDHERMHKMKAFTHKKLIKSGNHKVGKRSHTKNNPDIVSMNHNDNGLIANKRRAYPPRLHVVHPNNNIVTSPISSPTNYSTSVKQSKDNNPFSNCLNIRHVSSRGNLQGASVSGLVFSKR